MKQIKLCDKTCLLCASFIVIPCLGSGRICSNVEGYWHKFNVCTGEVYPA